MDRTTRRPAKRARLATPEREVESKGRREANDMPLDARLPPELWSRVFAAVDTPEAAAAWRATCKRARSLFDGLPGHDPSCGANRALYEACRRGDGASVDRLLADRRVVAAAVAAPNPHGSLFGHSSRWIAQRLLVAQQHQEANPCHLQRDAPRRIPIETRDVEAACAAARDDDAVPMTLLASLPTQTTIDGSTPFVTSPVVVSRTCVEAAVRHRRPLLVRTLLAFAATHPRATRDYDDLPARAAIAAVRRRDMAMLRVVLDADGYRVSESVLDRNHGDGKDDVDPLCEAVRRGWTEAVRLLANHRHYGLVGTHDAPLDRYPAL